MKTLLILFEISEVSALHYVLDRFFARGEVEALINWKKGKKNEIFALLKRLE